MLSRSFALLQKYMQKHTNTFTNTHTHTHTSTQTYITNIYTHAQSHLAKVAISTSRWTNGSHSSLFYLGFLSALSNLLFAICTCNVLDGCYCCCCCCCCCCMVACLYVVYLPSSSAAAAAAVATNCFYRLSAPRRWSINSHCVRNRWSSSALRFVLLLFIIRVG